MGSSRLLAAVHRAAHEQELGGTFGMMWAPFLAWVLDPFLLLSNELGKAKGRNLCCFPVVEWGGNSRFWGFESLKTPKQVSYVGSKKGGVYNPESPTSSSWERGIPDKALQPWECTGVV